MSAPNPAARPPRNLEQQHKLAKDLLRAAREGDADSLSRIRAHRTDADEPKLADAQLTIARDAGFASWPDLVGHLQKEEMRAFGLAVRKGDVAAVRQLLESSEHVRTHINDPVFAFGQRALHMAANNTELLDVLMTSGADLNLRSDWANGPYTVLDNADAANARFLIERGARLTPNVAARLGWFVELRTIVESDPSAVHERGGDGQQPLHLAKSMEIADYLLDHGADIDARCVDHQSTPAQYALTERTDVCRRLLARGAMPDIFMAARLGDLELVERLIDADPSCVAARVHRPGYAPVPELHIYCWLLGFLVSPHEVALKQGHQSVHELLERRSPPRVRLLNAAMRADEPAAREAIRQDPSLPRALTPVEASELADAVFHGRFEAADLMLRLGFDPACRGTDGGTTLHMACWMGNVPMVERLLKLGVAIDVVDTVHGSTPLGWAAFGSAHRCAKGGDYVGVIERLVAGGANVKAPGNGAGHTMISMANGNPKVQEALRHLGAG